MATVLTAQRLINGIDYNLSIETDHAVGCYSVYALRPTTGKRERVAVIGVVRANRQTCHTVKTVIGAFPRFDGLEGCMAFLIDHIKQFTRHDRDIYARMTME